MDNEIRQKLEEEILNKLDNLQDLECGSKESSIEIDDLVKLYKLSIEERKLELDFDEKEKRIDVDKDRYQQDYDIKNSGLVEAEETRLHEELFKKEQLNEMRKDRLFKVGIDTAGIIIPMIFYAIWMRKGFKFEETGTFTSTTFRGLFNRFRPTK